MLIGFAISPESRADTIQDLQNQINDRNAKVQALQKEIDQYQAELTATTKQAKTLQGNIKALDKTRAKLETEIKSALAQIDATNLEIEQLSIQINEQKNQINLNTKALTTALQGLQQSDSSTIIEAFLGQKNLSTSLSDIENLRQFQTTVQLKVEALRTLEQQLEGSVAASQQKQKELKSLKNQLSDKKQVVEYNQQQKNKLLIDTKNKESNYQTILVQKIALQKTFNQDLINFESQLKLKVDPNSIPSAATGVLSWPLSRVVITQYFGDTSFAQAHAAVYNGHGHNGIDFGAPIGSTIKSALSGTVLGTGDTDLACPGASYGRWVLVQHYNGLTTLYAHLSVIRVSKGQDVQTGDTLGYSGETGYATGPHLHFTVFASQGVEIASFPSKSCRSAVYTMPVANLTPTLTQSHIYRLYKITPAGYNKQV